MSEEEKINGKNNEYIIDIVLDYIKKYGRTLMIADNIRMQYKGIKEDTITGSRECYYIERVIKKYE